MRKWMRSLLESCPLRGRGNLSMVMTLFRYLGTFVRYFAAHKIIAAIALAALAGGGYYAYAT